MTIEASVVKTATTDISATGGANATLQSLGGGLVEHNAYYGTGSVLDRKTVSFKVSRPKPAPSAPNGYSQQRSSIVLKFPKLLANEQTVVDTVRITVASSSETTELELAEYARLGAQFLGLADYSSFWVSQSVK